jgi:hypothetical protein
MEVSSLITGCRNFKSILKMKSYVTVVVLSWWCILEFTIVTILVFLLFTSTKGEVFWYYLGCLYILSITT